VACGNPKGCNSGGVVFGTSTPGAWYKPETSWLKSRGIDPHKFKKAYPKDSDIYVNKDDGEVGIGPHNAIDNPRAEIDPTGVNIRGGAHAAPPQDDFRIESGGGGGFDGFDG
jgi:hypothetical protein